MSFGFSVGDFIAAIDLANKIRKEFVDAPGQFKTISDEIRALSIVLQDADVAFPNRELDDKQKRDLEDIDKGCRNVLDELQRILDKNTELSTEGGGVGKRIKRVWKRLNWKPEEINQLRSRISTNISLLNAFNGRLTRDDVVKLVRHQEDHARQTVLDWLTPIDFATQQSDFISQRQAGTGQWLLESAEFQTWVEADQQVLFCPGIPGAGKTILTSIVVDYLYTKFQKDADTGVAYLYCNFRQQDEQNAGELLASLLKQLAQGLSSLPESVKHLYDRPKDRRTRPKFDEISSTLQSVGTLYSRIFIVLDALDECQASNGCRNDLLKEIFAFQAKSRANIFTTSRFIPEIIEHFKDSIWLEIRASDHDVQRYLDGHMSQLSRCVLRSSELQDKIKAEIVKAVDGMFLLAKLHFDSLKGKTSPKAIYTALEKLPTGSEAYDHAYNDAMERIEGQLRDNERLAKQVLSWITCAKRPLTTSELEHALAIELEESQFDEENLSPIEDMVSVCAGLVTVDGESGIIRLVHYTTQEYFDRTWTRWFPDAETEITTTCITYLSFDIFECGFCQTDGEFEERLRSNQFFEYAARNWGYHARVASTGAEQLILRFLEDEAKLSACTQAMFALTQYSSHSNYSQEVPRQMTGLHLAAYFGVESIAHALLVGDSLDFQDSYGRTPLSLAAENGHEAVVKLLLDEGVGLESKDNGGHTPLSLAAENGHEVVVKLLLNKGADVNAQGGRYGNSLYAASLQGHERVVQLLLENGADQAIGRNDNHHTLHMASELGHTAVVRILLEYNADLCLTDQNGQTALFRASGCGHKDLAHLLLDAGANIDTRDNQGRSALHIAIYRGYETVAQALIERDANIHLKTYDGDTALIAAIRSGLEGTSRLLIMSGADVNSNCYYGYTALHFAARRGDDAIIHLLLRYGADKRLKNNIGNKPIDEAADFNQEKSMKILWESSSVAEPANYERALLSAAGRGHTKIVQLLLENEVNLESKYPNGQTALFEAASHGHEDTVRLLLEHGAKVDVRPSWEGNPLVVAAGRGYTAIVDLLIKYTTELEAKDDRGRTALHRAARCGDENNVCLLLNSGSNVHSRTDQNWTAVEEAAWGVYEAAWLKKGVQVDYLPNCKDKVEPRLYDRGILIRTAGSMGDTAGYGHERAIQLLLDHGADSAVTHNFGWTALHLAALAGNERIVRLLLEAGFRVMDRTEGLQLTALHAAAASGACEVVVRHLLQHGADPKAQDRDGRIPLQLAAMNGRVTTARLLLSKDSTDTELSDPEKWVATAELVEAVTAGKADIVEEYLKRDVQINVINTGNETLLHKAARNGSLCADLLDNLHWSAEQFEEPQPSNANGEWELVVSLLLNEAIDINAESARKETALHQAVLTGHKGIVELLLSKGANREAKTSGGLTALHCAVMEGTWEIVHLLLEQGADVMATAYGGRTSLHLAVNARFRSEYIATELLKYNIDVNANDDAGNTALHLAIGAYAEDIVGLLLERQADVNTKNVEGKTPLRMAMEQRSHSIIRLLLKHHADIDGEESRYREALNHAVMDDDWDPLWKLREYL